MKHSFSDISMHGYFCDPGLSSKNDPVVYPIVANLDCVFGSSLNH